MCIPSFSLVVSMKLNSSRKTCFFGRGRNCFLLECIFWWLKPAVDSAGAEPGSIQSFLLFLKSWNIGRVSFFTLAGWQTCKNAQVCWEWWWVQLDKIRGWGESIKGCLKKAWPVIQVVLKSQMVGRTWREKLYSSLGICDYSWDTEWTEL